VKPDSTNKYQPKKEYNMKKDVIVLVGSGAIGVAIAAVWP